MSDTIDVAAPAASEGPAAPVVENAPRPTPLGSQTPMPEKAPEPAEKPEAPSKTAAEAVKRATEKLNAKAEAEKAAKPAERAAPKETAAEARARAEDGKFAPKDGAQRAPEAKADTAQQEAPKPAPEAPKAPSRYEAPSRFSAEAKAEWESAPETVRAETHRALTELQQGYEKHSASAKAYESVKQFDEMAKQGGTTLPEALNKYVSLENMLRQNPIAGLEKVCENMGLSLRQVAAHVLNQTPDQQAQQSDRTAAELRNEIQSLKQQLGGVTGHIESQKQAQTVSEIEKFAASSPRFDELADDIVELLKTGYAKDLPDAYEKANRLKPGQAQAAVSAPTPTPTPLSPAGLKSITGAPSTGSDPANREAPVSTSPREALERAMRRVG